MGGNILLAVSEQQRREQMSAWLKRAGHSVILAFDKGSAAAAVRSNTWDMFILDSRLEGMNSFELVGTALRSRPGIPVAVAGWDSSNEAAAALKAGAHDYIPFEADEGEFTARVTKLFNLFEMKRLAGNDKIVIGDLIIDRPGRRAIRNGREVELTQKEFELLQYLSGRLNEVCTREDILMHVWDFDFNTGTNVVDVYILHLREKLDRGHKIKLIRTVRGAGYMLSWSGDGE